MTIEQKAKAYDEALEKAKRVLSNNCTEVEKLCLECVFSELTESEDDRIRKILIHIVKGACDKYGIKYKGDEITEEKLLAYLERQKKPENVSATTMIPSCWTEKQKEQSGEDEEDNDFTIYHPLKNGKGEYECIPYSFYGSLTSFSEDKDLIDFLRTCFYTEEECNEWIEQQKEQKSKTLIPKFQEGDIIISTKNNHLSYKILEIGHINELGNPEYRVEIFVDGKPDEPQNIKYIEIKKMDSWGELVEQKPVECIEFDNEFDNQISHLLVSVLNDEHEYNESFVKYVAQSLLEYAKNELKNAEWDDDDVHTRFAFYTYRDEPEVLYLSNVFVEETSRNKGLGTKILNAAEKVAETIGTKSIRLKVKQDSPANAWYRKHGYDYMTFEDGYDWLEKTLEYLKPAKQELSEDDKTNGWTGVDLERYLSCLRRLGTGNPQQPETSNSKWFKEHCRPQPHWKPSEEQMNSLQEVINILTNLRRNTGDRYNLESLYKQLEDL